MFKALRKASYRALFSLFLAVGAQLGRRTHQIAHPDQVVGRQREGEHPADPQPNRGRRVLRRGRRQVLRIPTEDFLDPFALLLAYQIAAMTSRALIDYAGRLARDMGRYPMLA